MNEPNLEAMRRELLDKDSEHGDRMMKLNTLVALEKITLANIAAVTHAINALGHLENSGPLLNSLRLLERHAKGLEVLDKLAETFGEQKHEPNWNRNGRQLAAVS